MYCFYTTTPLANDLLIFSHLPWGSNGMRGKILLTLAISQLKWDLEIISFITEENYLNGLFKFSIALLADLFHPSYSSEYHS